MIVIADLHLGKSNDSIMVDGIPSQTRDIRWRLGTVLARAKLTKQSIVVAGDIFNRVNPTSQAIAEFFDWLSKCSDAGVTVYLLAGNHDAGVDWTSTVLFYNANLSNVYVTTSLDSVVVHESDESVSREVVFLPHVPATVQEQAIQGHGSVSAWAAARFPDADFVITHGMIRGGDYVNDIFFEAGNAMEIDPSKFKNLKLMVLGHIHDHVAGDLWVYPGSLSINNFGEVGESKGMVEVNLEDLSYQWHEFPDDVTPWVHVELDMTDKDESSLKEDEIRDLVEDAVVKITVIAKSYGVINEAHIRQLFNKYGTVTRFETKVVGEEDRESKTTNNLSHEQLLKDYIGEMDAKAEVKKNAIAHGERIIAEVRG